MIEQRVTLRYGAQQIPAIVQAVQGDTGRDVIFELADYEIPAGATANYYIDKPDGNAVYNSAGVISSTEILAHLTEQALAEPGRNNGQVRILSDGEVITSFDFVLEVEAFRGILQLQSETEVNIFDDAIQAAAEDAIAEIQAQTPVVTGMQNSIAPTYSSSSTYAVGDFVMYNAQLYKCNTAITTAEAWTEAHWTQVPLSDDVRDLNALNNNLLSIYNVKNGYISNSGVFVKDSNYLCTEYIPVCMLKNIYNTQPDENYPLHIHFFDNDLEQTRYTSIGLTTSFPVIAASNDEKYVRIWRKADSIVEMMTSFSVDWITDVYGDSFPPYWINGLCANNGDYYYSSSYITSSFIAIKMINSIIVKRQGGINLNFYGKDHEHLGIGTLSYNDTDFGYVPAGAEYVKIWFGESDPKNYAESVNILYGPSDALSETFDILSGFSYVPCKDKAEFLSGRVFRVDTEQVVGWSGYGLYVLRDLTALARIIVTGYSESLSTFGYGIFDEDDTLLAKGGLSNNLSIPVPDNASYIYISIKLADKDNIQYKGIYKTINEIMKLQESSDVYDSHIIVIGDSWSDTDPLHTSYTKWPVIFQQNIPCTMHVYAQNGSGFYGETPSYQTNGNVKGQTQAAINDNSFDHDSVDLIIAMGTINDFRNGVSVSDVVTAITNRINEMKAEFTNARTVLFLNNQVFVTDDLWNFIQGVKNGVKQSLGIPVHNMLGWVPVEHYISDLVHVDDVGYKMLAANVIACCYGGNPTFVKNESEYTITDGDSRTHTLKISETFTDDSYEKSLTLIVPSEVSSSTSLSLQPNASDKKLMCMVEEHAFMQNIGRTTASSLNNLRTSYYQAAITTTDGQHRGTMGTITMQTGQYGGTYKGRSASVK